MKSYTLIFSLLFTIILSGCSNKETNDQQVELTISAAASLQTAISEIATNYEKKHKNTKIVLNLGGSGALQQQITQGAPVDLFISASKSNFFPLLEKGMIDKKYNIDLLSNELVLITGLHNNHIQSFEDLPSSDVHKIALGAPESVPAGMYAKQSFEFLNIWDDVEEKIVAAKDVRQVLTYTETENVDAGIVYATDAKLSDKVKIAAKAEKSWHSPITYPVGVLKKSKNKKEAILFYEFLRNKESKKIFMDYGFKVNE